MTFQVLKVFTCGDEGSDPPMGGKGKAPRLRPLKVAKSAKCRFRAARASPTSTREVASKEKTSRQDAGDMRPAEPRIEPASCGKLLNWGGVARDRAWDC